MVQIEKSFPGVYALRGVDFRCRPGTVHGLVGENGAGKSTLIKILGGVIPPDSGKIILKGRQVVVGSPAQAAKLGISTIHQELNLIPALTVAQNILLGHEVVKRFGTIDRTASHGRAKKLLSLVGVDVDPGTPVGRLSLAQKQLVEIAKALSVEASVIVMDEPTAALNGHEVESLFTLIRRLVSEGQTVIFISHRLEEIFAICDEITVLRDGTVAGGGPVSDLDRDLLVKMMTGKAVSLARLPGKVPVSREVLLEVSGLCAGSWFSNVSFKVHRNEIVGLVGLEGQGQREVLRALFGAMKLDHGTVRVNGREVRLRNPRDAMRSRIAFVPEERKLEGVCLRLNLANNICLPTVDARQSFGFVDSAREQQLVSRLIGELRINPPSPGHLANNLSGGNQQKVVVAKWLAAEPSVLLFSEPTRGIDVGAKEEIYQLMRLITDAGGGVLMVSSDMLEVMRICDRIIVMHDGRVVREFDAETADRETIMAAQWGITAETEAEACR
jgi:ribose transport system ATP-binding protein